MKHDCKSLGRFVRVRDRADGTQRVFMSVPRRCRPSGWPANIQLPEIGVRRGSLADPKFKQIIVNDAQRLNTRLDLRRDREAALAQIARKSVIELAEIYFRRDIYLELSPSRLYRNRRNMSKIAEWSAARGHPDVRGLTAMDVDDCLSNYRRRSATRFEMRSMWNMLFATAIYAGWIKDSPLARGNWETPNPKHVAVWKTEDVDRFSAMAVRMKQPGLAALMVAMLAIGQRLGDMRKARWDHEFFGDRFIIKQGKTGQTVNIPIPESLRHLLKSVRLPDSPYVFNDFDTREGFSDYRLGLRFSEIRHAVTDDEGPVFHLRALRHACVCHLMEAGLPTAEIAGITGHRLARVHTILERYYPDRWGMAERGMRRVFAARGGEPSAFGEVKPMSELNWTPDAERAERYAAPKFTERNVERLLAAMTGQHRQGARLVISGEPFDIDERPKQVA